MRDALDELKVYVMTHSGEMSANRAALVRLIEDAAVEKDDLAKLLAKEQDFSLECGLEMETLRAEFDAYRESHPDMPLADIDAGAREDMLFDREKDERALSIDRDTEAAEADREWMER